MLGSDRTRAAGRAATAAGRCEINHARRAAATAPRLFRLVAAAALLALAAAPVSAQVLPAEPPAAPSAALAGPNFTQRGIPAEATAENGVLAREKALAAGRRLAWEKLAAEAGASPGSLSDARIESMVSSIVIEQERVTPTRYTGRITVNFDPNRARSALGSRGGGPAVAAAPSPTDPAALPSVAAPQGPPASNWVDAVATYRSLGEWLELKRRLSGAAPVASVDVVGIAVDAARLRIGLRAPPPAAAGELAGLGIAMAPVRGAPSSAPGGETWRVGLAGGG